MCTTSMLLECIDRPGSSLSHGASWKELSKFFGQVALYAAGFPCTPYSSLHNATTLLQEAAVAPMWQCVRNMKKSKPAVSCHLSSVGHDKCGKNMWKHKDHFAFSIQTCCLICWYFCSMSSKPSHAGRNAWKCARLSSCPWSSLGHLAQEPARVPCLHGRSLAPKITKLGTTLEPNIQSCPWNLILIQGMKLMSWKWTRV